MRLFRQICHHRCISKHIVERKGLDSRRPEIPAVRTLARDAVAGAATAEFGSRHLGTDLELQE